MCIYFWLVRLSGSTFQIQIRAGGFVWPLSGGQGDYELGRFKGECCYISGQTPRRLVHILWRKSSNLKNTSNPQIYLCDRSRSLACINWQLYCIVTITHNINHMGCSRRQRWLTVCFTQYSTRSCNGWAVQKWPCVVYTVGGLIFVTNNRLKRTNYSQRKPCSIFLFTPSMNLRKAQSIMKKIKMCNPEPTFNTHAEQTKHNGECVLFRRVTTIQCQFQKKGPPCDQSVDAKKKRWYFSHEGGLNFQLKPLQTWHFRGRRVQ